MTNWQETILSKLDKYTGFEIVNGDGSITVSCNNPESFDVSFHALGKDFQVSFDGWHELFDAEEDALNCFAFGLSKECRLKVAKRGKMECSWTAQYWRDDKWIDDTTTGLIVIPFWRSKKIEYGHNLINSKTS